MKNKRFNLTVELVPAENNACKCEGCCFYASHDCVCPDTIECEYGYNFKIVENGR